MSTVRRIAEYKQMSSKYFRSVRLYLKSNCKVSDRHVNHVTSWVLAVMKSNGPLQQYVCVYVYVYVVYLRVYVYVYM